MPMMRITTLYNKVEVVKWKYFQENETTDIRLPLLCVDDWYLHLKSFPYSIIVKKNSLKIILSFQSWGL